MLKQIIRLLMGSSVLMPVVVRAAEDYDTTTTASGGLLVLGVLFPLLFMGLILALTVFWVFMVIDVAKREFPKPDEKIVWVLIVILLGQLGAIIYYFVVKKNPQYTGSSVATPVGPSPPADTEPKSPVK